MLNSVDRSWNFQTEAFLLCFPSLNDDYILYCCFRAWVLKSGGFIWHIAVFPTITTTTTTPPPPPHTISHLTVLSLIQELTKRLQLIPRLWKSLEILLLLRGCWLVSNLQPALRLETSVRLRYLRRWQRPGVKWLTDVMRLLCVLAALSDWHSSSANHPKSPLDSSAVSALFTAFC